MYESRLLRHGEGYSSYALQRAGCGDPGVVDELEPARQTTSPLYTKRTIGTASIVRVFVVHTGHNEREWSPQLLRKSSRGKCFCKASPEFAIQSANGTKRAGNSCVGGLSFGITATACFPKRYPNTLARWSLPDTM